MDQSNGAGIQEEERHGFLDTLNPKSLNTVGNKIVDKRTPDAASKVQYIDTDLVFSESGRVVSWDLFTRGKGRQAMQVWRPVVPAGFRDYAPAEVTDKGAIGTGKGSTTVISGKSFGGTSGLSAWNPRDLPKSETKPGKKLTADNMKFDAYQTTIDVDGLFADWDCMPFLGQPVFQAPATHPKEIFTFEEYNHGTWKGIYDHSVALSFAWDANSFYIGVKVVDDSHQLNGKSGWNGDSVQVVFADVTRKGVTHLYNYAESEAGDHIAHHERGPHGTQVVIERNEKTKTTGYEIKVPAKSLGHKPFKRGDIVAVGITVNDGDQEKGQHGQKGWSGWGPHSAVYGKTASECGLVTLSGSKPDSKKCTRLDQVQRQRRAAATLYDKCIDVGDGHQVRWHFGGHPPVGASVTFGRAGIRSYPVNANVLYGRNSVRSYALINQNMLWKNALTYCADNGYATLASIHSAKQAATARALCTQRTGGNPCTCDPYKTTNGLMSKSDKRGCSCPRGDTCAAKGKPKKQDKCTGSCGCWIGLSNAFNVGQLVWSDGSTIHLCLLYSETVFCQSVQNYVFTIDFVSPSVPRP